MLVKNVHIENDDKNVDIRTRDGFFKEIGTDLHRELGEEVVDYHGAMVLPPFIESHVHLDTCLTAGEPEWNISGTLFEGISRWSQRKETMTKADVKKRAWEVIRSQVNHGIQHIRTHVDVTDPQLTALEGLLEVKEELKDSVNMQIVAFPQEGILSYKNGKELLEKALTLGADCIGAIPHYEYTREYGLESIQYTFEMAEKHDKLIDVHCDEIDDEQSRFLETVACFALETEMRSRVTASHTTAMHSYNNAYTCKLFNLLRRSEINFVANPLVNIHLQGRLDSYPKRRGVTRVKELLAEGMNVSFGHDDIFDSWYPLGTGNMMDVVHMGLHVCQMMGYEEICNSYKLVTHNAAKTLNLNNYGIKVGHPANFIVIDSENFYTALNKRAVVLASFREGKLIARTRPVQRETLI